MSTEEIKEVVNPEVNVGEVTPQDTPEYSPDEVQAMEHGWRPKEQWDGHPDDWVSAREFNRRGELFARISKYGNENKEMREQLKKLFNQHRNLYDAGYKKAISDLKQQKLEAAEEGDTRKLLEIDDQLESLQEEHKKAVSEFDQSILPEPQVGVNQEQQIAYENFLLANPWYGKNADLTRVADNLAKNQIEAARRAGKQIELKKLFADVAREVREHNPQHFALERKTSGVESGSTRREAGNRGGKYSLSQIPEAEREIARTVILQAGMTEEDYVKSYLNAQRG